MGRATGGFVVEDDYDAEFRYDREPVGSVQGLAPDHVVVARDGEQVAGAGLRLGWIVAPGHLLGALAQGKLHRRPRHPGLDQLAWRR